SWPAEFRATTTQEPIHAAFPALATRPAAPSRTAPDLAVREPRDQRAPLSAAPGHALLRRRPRLRAAGRAGRCAGRLPAAALRRGPRRPRGAVHAELSPVRRRGLRDPA